MALFVARNNFRYQKVVSTADSTHLQLWDCIDERECSCISSVLKQFGNLIVFVEKRVKTFKNKLGASLLPGICIFCHVQVLFVNNLKRSNLHGLVLSGSFLLTMT